MDTQTTEAVGELPASEVPSNSSVNLNMDSTEVLDECGDQIMREDTAFQENSEPEDQNQGVANEEGKSDLLRLSFPRKLWMIVENKSFKSVCWNDDGDTVIIDVDLFQKEILNKRGAERIFETDSLKTFIYQLNLHGFRKIRPDSSAIKSQENRRMMIYYNANFQRDNPGLLENIWRKGDLRTPVRQVTCIPTTDMNSAEHTTCAPIPKRKKLQPVICSPEFYHKTKEKNNEEPQREVPNNPGPRGSVPGYLLENWCPLDSKVPDGEGTSADVMFVPPVTVGMEGTGEVSSSSSVFPNYGSVTYLYNTCYCILLVVLSVISQNEFLNYEEDDEQLEGSSDSTCTQCDQFKDNLNP